LIEASAHDNISYMVRLVLLCLLLVVSFAAESLADIYRYVDENGVVCYTDAPLDKKKAKRIIRTDSPVTDSERVSYAGNDFHSIVVDKASKYELDPSLVHAVIKTESNGNPRAVSSKGAMGLMQLMPTTANDLEVRNPFDPEENIDGGTKYLKYLIERFNGDLTLALAAYNAGPKRVEKTGSVPQISETKQYVKKVLSLYNGRTVLPVSSGGPRAVASAPRNEPIYKVLTEDGSVLFTNSPHYSTKKTNARF